MYSGHKYKHEHMHTFQPHEMITSVFITQLAISITINKFVLTKVKIFSDCVIKAILDQWNWLMACTIPGTISASLDTVLRKYGNTWVLERRGDDDAGEI